MRKVVRSKILFLVIAATLCLALFLLLYARPTTVAYAEDDFDLAQYTCEFVTTEGDVIPRDALIYNNVYVDTSGILIYVPDGDLDTEDSQTLACRFYDGDEPLFGDEGEAGMFLVCFRELSFDEEDALEEILRMDAGHHTVYVPIFTGTTGEEYEWHTLDLEILPRVLHVTFDALVDYEYTGLPIEHRHTEEGWGVDDVGSLQVLYNGSPTAVNVGDYEVSVESLDPNYRVADDIGGSTQVRINPRPLVVGIEPMTVNQGEVPQFKFTYTGFVPGEDESLFTVRPTVNFNTSVPGTYQVTINPGAQVPNYTVNARAGLLTVNAVSLSFAETTDAPGVVVSGSFAPGSVLQVNHGNTESDNYKMLLDRMDNKLLRPSPDAYYQIDIQGRVNSSGFKLQISKQKFSPVAQLRIVVMDPDGNLYRVNKYAIKNDVLTFDCPTEGDVLIFEDYTIFGTVMGVVGFILLAILAFKLVERYRYKQVRKEGKQPKDDEPRYKW